MTKVRAGRWTAAIALFLCVGAAGFVSAMPVERASAQDSKMVIRVVPPKESVKKGETVNIDINAENATNEASFQFDLQFNADIFEFQDAERGEFLTSTGREAVCNTVSDVPGVARYTCVTLRPDPKGPDGNGKLATIVLKATGSGTTELRLDRVSASKVEDGAPQIPLTSENASIKVTGGGSTNWLLWIAIIVIGVVVVAGAAAFGAMRMRAAGGRPATAS